MSINIDWMPAGDEPDVLKKMVALIDELLDCLPDSRKWGDDETWKWCWEELSDEAQNRVVSVRQEAARLLQAVKEVQGEQSEH